MGTARVQRGLDAAIGFPADTPAMPSGSQSGSQSGAACAGADCRKVSAAIEAYAPDGTARTGDAAQQQEAGASPFPPLVSLLPLLPMFPTLAAFASLGASPVRSSAFAIPEKPSMPDAERLLGLEFLRDLGRLDARRTDAELRTLGRETVLDYFRSGGTAHLPLLVRFAEKHCPQAAHALANGDTAGAADAVDAFLRETFHLEYGICDALDKTTNLAPKGRRSLACQFLSELGLDPERTMDFLPAMEPQIAPGPYNVQRAADFYVYRDTLTARDLRRMSPRPLGDAQVQDMLRRLPPSLNARFDEEFDRSVAAASAGTHRLVDSWLKLLKPELGIDIDEARISVSRLVYSYPKPRTYSLPYLNMLRSRGISPRFENQARAHGYLLSIDHPAGKWDYFLCSESVRAIRIPKGNFTGWVNGNRDRLFHTKLFEQFRQTQEDPAQPPRLGSILFCSGRRAELGKLLAPALASEMEERREDLRGIASGELLFNLLIGLIPFSDAFKHAWRGDWLGAMHSAQLELIVMQACALGGKAVLAIAKTVKQSLLPVIRLVLLRAAMGMRIGVRGAAARLTETRQAIRAVLRSRENKQWERAAIRQTDVHRVADSVQDSCPRLAAELEHAVRLGPVQLARRAPRAPATDEVGRIFDMLKTRIQGEATAAQLDAMQQALQRVGQDPVGLTLLRGLQAQHEVAGRGPAIVFPKGAGQAGAAPSSAGAGGAVWELDPEAFNALPADEAVRKLASVYDDMTGILSGRRPFGDLPVRGKPEVDQALETAWKDWVGAGEPAHADMRQAVVDRLRRHAQEWRLFGGVDQRTFKDLVAGWRPSSLSRRIELSNCGLTSLPPMPEGVHILVLNGNRIADWRHMPAALEALDAGGNSLSRVPENLPGSLRELRLAENAIGELPANLPESLTVLDVSDNALTVLPALPETLEKLTVNRNMLTDLPEHLPRQLQELHVSGNGLTRLRSELPPNVQMLDVSYNGLTELPANLPDGLLAIYAHDNRLLRLPERLPRNLERLDVSGNRLTAMPDNIYEADGALISALRNPIPQDVQRAVHYGPTGPIIIFPNWTFLPFTQAIPERNVIRSVRDWFDDLAGDAITRWETIAPAIEETAQGRDFQGLLDKLKDTALYRDAGFRKHVSLWLDELSRPDRQALRETTLSACAGANDSCVDRALWTYSQLQALRLNSSAGSDILHGGAAEVIAAGRQMFRLDALEKIARAKMKTLTDHPDEVEVYLAYAVQLRKPLGLATVVPEMRYYTISGVTDSDLFYALNEIRMLESKPGAFAEYMLDYEPWIALLRNRNPQAAKEADAAARHLLDTRLESMVNQELARNGIGLDDADARRTLEIVMSKRLRLQAWKRLFQQYMAAPT
jgi:hypothetical protein